MASENQDESLEDVAEDLDKECPPGRDEGLEAAEVTSLNFVLRASQWRAKIAEYVRATPWWVISIALHVAAILILGKIVMMSRPPPEDDLIVTTEIRTEDIKPVDLKKIERVFQNTKVEQTEPVVHAPTLVHQPVTEVTETTTVETSDLVQTAESIVPADESFTGIEETGEIGDGAGMGELESTDVIGIGESGFNARGAGYQGIMRHLTGRLGKISRGGRYNGNVLLVWVIDASLSMLDDQRAIKERLWEMDRKFREQEGAGELMQAVVYYSDKPHLWLKPTSDVDRVMQAIDAIELSPPGTTENTMAAVIYAANTFAESTHKGKKVLVLVDDDSPDDSDLLEKALAELRKTQTTLFVINRECPFQSQYLLEPFEFVDRDGEKFSGMGTVHRGPETAYPEGTGVSWGGFYSVENVLSGFGIYDISRLAFYSGGAYYILDPMPEAEKQTMYDWDLMEVYRPELVSREEYQKRTMRNPYKAAVEAVIQKMNTGGPRWVWFGVSEARVQIADCNKKLSLTGDLIQGMEQNAIMPTSQLENLTENRRWPANADLVMASLVLARHRIRQFKLCLEDFLEETHPLPAGNVITFVANQPVKATKDEANDREMVIRAMRFVADRHPRTPWGRVASQFDPNSNAFFYGFKFSHYRPSPPAYCAIVETSSGQKYQATVSEGDHNMITISVANKGSKTVNKNLIKKITPIPCPGSSSSSGGGGGGNPRI
ncbi:MAG: VWA domain-containing protein [Planctomycetes bacterium]|nr:VWA domain-containing protein [Planctomycetota bacterium]